VGESVRPGPTPAPRPITIPPPPEGGTFVSVGVKLPLATVLVVVAITALTYVALTQFERENLLRAKETAALMIVELFADAVSAPVVFEDPTGITDTLAYLGHNEDVDRAYVWRGEPSAPEVLGSYERTPGPAPALHAQGTWRSETELWVTMPIHDPAGDEIARATASFSLAPENEAFAALSTRILGSAAAIAGLLTLVLAWMSRRTIVTPLVSLVSLARALEQGAAVKPVARSNDEIGRLGSALERMATAVALREQAIAAKNADLRRVLDNVQQGFLVLDRSGRLVGERSAMVDRWLDGADLGVPFASILLRVDPIVGETFELGWESLIEGVMPMDLCLSQLPSKYKKDGQHYRIEYRPVGDEENFEAMMVVISDVTSQIVRAQAEAQQRELMSAVTRFVADRSGFLAFIAEGTTLRKRISAEAVDGTTLLRDVHTLKGIAAMNGADRVASICHEVENLAAERADLPTSAERASIGEAWESLAARIRPLSNAGGEGRVELTAREIDELVRAIQDKAPHATLLHMVDGWSGEPIEPRLRQLAEEASRLGTQLGKPAPEVTVDGAGLRAPESWAPFWSALVHLARNAMDHGIEAAAVREAAGKKPRGTLGFAASRIEGGIAITLTDDGAGIDWDALATKAKSRGLRADTKEALVDALFTDGVSTRTEVTEVSGRGVGLAALREVVVSMGGELRVESTRGRGTRFEARIPFVQGKRLSQRPPSPARAEGTRN
jgi:HPt (histidine-containing phosphotransfer) domain-containing protein/HAMP domain-containing protein